MTKFLKQDYFNAIWQEISRLYVTMVSVQSLAKRASIQPQQVDLHGTGQDMVFSLISFAEKENKVQPVLETALLPTDYEGNAELERLLKAIKDDSAYLPPATGEESAPAEEPKPPGKGPVKVMLIGDPKDQKMTNDLKTHLSIFEKILKTITIFDMNTSPEVGGGANKKSVIETQLKESEIILLLLTPNFFTSAEGCFELAVNAFQQNKRVIPVLLEPCLWDRIAVLENIVPLPRNKEYVSRWRNKDEALLEIANGVDQVASAMKLKNP